MFVITCPYSFSQISFHKADSVVDFLKGNWQWKKSCGGWSGCTTEFDNPRIFCFDTAGGSDDSLSLRYFRDDTLFYALNYNVSYSPVAMYGNEYYWTLRGDYDRWAIDFYSSDSIRMRMLADDGMDITLARGGIIAWTDLVSPEEVTVFPNPCNDYVVIGDENAGMSNIQIYDSRGRLIKDIDLNHRTSCTINMTVFPPGFYFIKASSRDKRYFGKVWKE
jgi:hypothetical protein